MIVEVFQPGHLAAMNAQAAQQAQARAPAEIATLARGGRAFTARAGAGTPPLLCGGAFELHPGYATLWSLVSADAGPHMAALTRRVRHFILTLPHGRIDAMVAPGFAAGAKWMRLLGFAFEARLHAILPDGGDCDYYRWEG